MFRRFFLFLKISVVLHAAYLVLSSTIEYSLQPNLGTLVDLLNTASIGLVLSAFLSLYLAWKRTKLDYPVHPPQSAQNLGGNQ